MATAGSIVIDLLMKTGSFSTDTGRAEKRLKDLQKTAKAAGAVIGTAFVAAGTALTVITGQAINAADEMRDLSIRLGTSTETLSAFGYAASQTGTDIETVGKGLKILSKNVADSLNPTNEYAKVFDALGINVKDSEGKLKGMSELVPEIADRFKLLEDGTTKSALALSLFGRAGLDMTEFLNGGSQGLSDFAKKAADLGVVIDSQTATAADDFNDILGDLRTLVAGFGLTVARDLLPGLVSAAARFRDIVKDGDLARNTVTLLSGAFSLGVGIMEGYTKAVNRLTIMFEFAAKAGEGLQEVQKNFGVGGLFSEGSVSGGIEKIKQAAAEGDAALAELEKDRTVTVDIAFAGEGSEPIGLFRMSTKELELREQVAEMERRIAEALSNPTATGGGGRAKQLSDEEKEAKRLLETYRQLTAGFDERIALFGQEGEAAKVRYDIEHGELAKLAPAQQADLLAKAERLDLIQEEADELRKLADAEQQLWERYEDSIGAIRDETEALGMSADQQEVWNRLRWLGKDATDAMRNSVIEQTRALQEQREAMSDQIEAMDSLRDAGKGLFRDIIDDPKNWKDAVFDALDSVQDRILDMIAENWMDQLFGKRGDPAGGSTGGFFSSLLGAFFGGARADGGDAMANRAYLVGEQGPELFVPRTAGSVIPAGQSASIMSGGGRNVSVIQNFTAQGRIDPHTASQMAQDAAVKLRIATARA